MRLFVAVALLAGCAHVVPSVSGPSMELALDDGHATEKPLTPQKTFEMLMKLDPQLPSYSLRRLRFLLAQPGHIVFTIYEVNADGQPGRAITSIDRTYDPAWCSSGRDGRWVTEPVELPTLHGPIFVGISSPGGGGDPRLWASSNATQLVYQRDADPSAPLGAIPRTPILRVEVAP